MKMLVDTNFYNRATYCTSQMGAIYIEYSVEWCPLEVCNMAVSIDYFPYARHQHDLHVVSHFDIMTNHVVSISIYFIDKETNIESLNYLPMVTQLVSCRSRIQTQNYLSPKLILLIVSLS